MLVRMGLICSLALGMISMAGCMPSGPPKPKDVKQMMPVKGIVNVDGQPAADLVVMCVEEAQVNNEVVDGEYSSGHGGRTDAAGKFSISSIYANDGVPAGNYVVIFRQGTGKEKTENKGNLKFNTKFANPSTSTVKFTAEAGKPVDLGTIELKTK